MRGKGSLVLLTMWQIRPGLNSKSLHPMSGLMHGEPYWLISKVLQDYVVYSLFESVLNQLNDRNTCGGLLIHLRLIPMSLG